MAYPAHDDLRVYDVSGKSIIGQLRQADGESTADGIWWGAFLRSGEWIGQSLDRAEAAHWVRHVHEVRQRG